MKLNFLILYPKITAEVPVHEHRSYEFHYVVSGSGHFRMGNRRFAVQRGDFFYNEPGVEHQMYVTEDQDYLLQYAVGLYLDEKQDRKLAGDLKKHFTAGKRHRLGDGRHLFFEQMTRLHASGEAHLKRAALHGFIGLVYEVIGGKVGSAPGNAAVEEALRLLDSGVTRGIGLDEVATHLGLSKSYLVRLFKKHVGVSPMRYANNLRMEVAAQMLRQSDASVSEVAGRVGFTDEYQFNKRFKQWSGKPPGRFRRQSRG